MDRMSSLAVDFAAPKISSLKPSHFTPISGAGLAGGASAR
jgi:hypothetical protein